MMHILVAGTQTVNVGRTSGNRDCRRRAQRRKDNGHEWSRSLDTRREPARRHEEDRCDCSSSQRRNEDETIEG